MTLLDKILLLATGLVAIYLLYRFWGRYSKTKALYDVYYMLGFAVLLISGLLLIFLGYDILASPYVLTVASLIPLGISMGIAEQYFPSWKKAFKWFALIGFAAIAITSVGGMVTHQEDRRPAVPRSGGPGDLPGAVPGEESAEGILVGWHRRPADRAWRHSAGIHLSRLPAVVLQPNVRIPDPGRAAAPDGACICLGVHEGHQRLARCGLL